MFNYIIFGDKDLIRAIAERLRKRQKKVKEDFLGSVCHKFIMFENIEDIKTYQRNIYYDINKHLYKIVPFSLKQNNAIIENIPFRFVYFGNINKFKHYNQRFTDLVFRYNIMLFNNLEIISENIEEQFYTFIKHFDIFLIKSSRLNDRKKMLDNLDKCLPYVEMLDETSQKIVKMFYGIGYEKKTVKEIANCLNIQVNRIIYQIDVLTKKIVSNID